ncbi:TPA: hypothetical protein DDZ86_00735 [Candidatus Dependentiae bacterium]|nr:MAG: FHA domain containing protein [candidate division TM6 bacterium GW2011_GWF2_43_87]HBL98150.1 hypothetical protein [Candidatus Dependentiae bacterium]
MKVLLRSLLVLLSISTFILSCNDGSDLQSNNRALERKECTILIYMAADNDLYPFASQNLAQLKEVGSNEHLNILVHLDIKVPGQKKVTKHLLIKKNQILQIGPDMCLNSGSAETLIQAALWAINNYPANHFILDFWNHGSGDLNPRMDRTINPAYLFRYNEVTGLIELDRSISFTNFIDLVGNKDKEELCDPNRGICFDETFHAYLDDSKLMKALTRITSALGKHIDLIMFDACLMAGTGTACIASQFADYMTASEEVVLGPGYNYKLVVNAITSNGNNIKQMAKDIVIGYEATYGKLTSDYTHSAFDLSLFTKINNNIDLLAQLLIEALDDEKNNTLSIAIRSARSRFTCTYFEEPSYIDLFHFYNNLKDRLSSIILSTPTTTSTMQTALNKVLNEGLALMPKFIIANVRGSNLAGARGLSIYFPEQKINNPHHNSYQYTEFAQHNNWLQFLKAYNG